MDGIEKITTRIGDDAQKEIDAMTAQAKSQVEEIASVSRAQAKALAEELAVKGKQAAAEREERMKSVAQLDARKVILAAKQETLDKAFELALKKLCSMDDEKYIDLLAKLLVKASQNGREQVVFNQKDRTRVGKEAVTRANELLAKPGKSQPSAKKGNPSEKGGKSRQNRTGDGGDNSGAVKKSGQELRLAAETRNIQGGFILLDGKVETNCAFETLVRLEKSSMAGEIAKLLFD